MVDSGHEVLVVELVQGELLRAVVSGRLDGRGLGAQQRAGTVLLARGVLAERIGRGQLAGLGASAVAVSPLALA